ncbi:MAG TPA: murein biosynthesis integral membrane protein MurJ [Myxococcota bacterium]|nr:murein biosynthesis integral membrane protein MurJ [Myxococcota bacterium]
MSRATVNVIIVAACGLLSRVLGIGREMLMAHAAGVTAEKNAYDLAFMIPDILNHVVSTGFLAIIFIPIFQGFRTREDDDGAWHFLSNTLTVLGAVLLLLMIPTMIWMRELLSLFTAAASLTPDILDRATYLSRIILPGQFFIFVGSYFMALQNCREQYLIPAMTGAVYNVAIIVGGLIGLGSGLEGFAWGVPAGGFVGFLVLQVIGARREGIKYRPVFKPFDPMLRHYLALMVPLSIGLGSQFGMELVMRALGGIFGASSISSLNYAYKVMFTVVSVFGYSVGVTGYPRMSLLVKQGRFQEVNRDVWRSLSRMFVLLTAAVVAVWVLSFPIVRVLFERGAFTREDTELVTTLLRWYLPATLGLSMQVVLVRAFYAHERMWMPTIINSGVFLLTIPAYFLLAERAGVLCVPMVGAAGVLTQIAVMSIAWARRHGREGMRLALQNIGRALAVLLFMVAVARFIETFTAQWVRQAGLATLIVYAGAAGLVLMSASLVLQSALGSNDAADIIAMFAGKISRKLRILKRDKG